MELSSLLLEQSFESQPGRAGSGFAATDASPDEIVEGLLRCQGCARRYPIHEGIPVLLREPLGAAELLGLTAQPLLPELLSALAEPMPDDSALPHQLESLGAYLDASWGDCAVPAPDGPVPAFGFAELAGRMLARLQAPVARALELGCGVGRGLSCLRRGARLVVGVDRNPAALRLARQILRGDEVLYPRRRIGRTYARAAIRAGGHAAPDVQLVCADALEPPFAPAGFERVAAINLLDSVRAPKALLHHLHQLCAPAGELLVASPYAWRSGITLEEERLGGAEPEAALRALLAGQGFSIEEEAARIPWVLRRDARSASRFDVHFLRARRA